MEGILLTSRKQQQASELRRATQQQQRVGQPQSSKYILLGSLISESFACLEQTKKNPNTNVETSSTTARRSKTTRNTKKNNQQK